MVWFLLQFMWIFRVSITGEMIQEQKHPWPTLSEIMHMLHEMNQTMATVTKENELLKHNVSNLHKSLESKDGDISALKQQIAILTVDDTMLKHIVLDLYDSLAQKEGDISTLKLQLTNVTKGNSMLKDNVTKLYSSLAHKANDISTLKQELAAVAVENTIMKHDVSILYNSMTQKESDIATLVQELATIKHNEKNVFASLTQMETDISTLRQDIGSTLPENPVAFYALLSRHIALDHLHQLVVYDNVLTNVGKGYHDGVFTAPVKGVYMFSVSVMGFPNLPTHLDIIHNGNVVGNARSEASTDLDLGTRVIVLTLNQADWVWIRYQAGGRHLQTESFNTFSGFLIKSM